MDPTLRATLRILKAGLRRNVIIVSAIWLVCYVGVYITLSLQGAYIHGSVSARIYWIWAPRSYPLDFPPRSMKYQLAWGCVFMPLWMLDIHYWHNDDSGRSGPRRIHGQPYNGDE
jgi:hypothetical protein